MPASNEPKMPKLDLLQPVCVLSIAYFSRNYLDDKNPEHLTYVRLAFGFSICLVLLLDLLIYFSISSRGDTSETKIEAKNPQTGQMEVFNSKKEYDFSDFKKKLKQTVMGVCIVSFIHYKWQIMVPLCVQSVLQPLTLLKSHLAKIYIFNDDSVKRPFDDGSANNPFAQMLKSYKEATNEGTKKKKKKKKSE